MAYPGSEVMVGTMGRLAIEVPQQSPEVDPQWRSGGKAPPEGRYILTICSCLRLFCAVQSFNKVSIGVCRFVVESVLKLPICTNPMTQHDRSRCPPGCATDLQ